MHPPTPQAQPLRLTLRRWVAPLTPHLDRNTWTRTCNMCVCGPPTPCTVTYDENAQYYTTESTASTTQRRPLNNHPVASQARLALVPYLSPVPHLTTMTRCPTYPDKHDSMNARTHTHTRESNYGMRVRITHHHPTVAVWDDGEVGVQVTTRANRTCANENENENEKEGESESEKVR